MKKTMFFIMVIMIISTNLIVILAEPGMISPRAVVVDTTRTSNEGDLDFTFNLTRSDIPVDYDETAVLRCFIENQESKDIIIRITNPDGRRVLPNTTINANSSKTLSLDGSGICTGTYYVYAYNSDGSVITVRLRGNYISTVK